MLWNHSWDGAERSVPRLASIDGAHFCSAHSVPNTNHHVRKGNLVSLYSCIMFRFKSLRSGGRPIISPLTKIRCHILHFRANVVFELVTPVHSLLVGSETRGGRRVCRQLYLNFSSPWLLRRPRRYASTLTVPISVHRQI